MLCENCGKENPNDQIVCDNCGARLTGDPAQQQQSAATPPPLPPLTDTRPSVSPSPSYSQNYNQPQYNYPQMSGNHAPLTTWGFMWTMLVTAIPLVGFVVLIVWAFSDSINRNRRNYARACLCFFLIAIGISIIAVIGAGLIGLLAAGTSGTSR